MSILLGALPLALASRQDLEEQLQDSCRYNLRMTLILDKSHTWGESIDLENWAQCPLWAVAIRHTSGAVFRNIVGLTSLANMDTFFCGKCSDGAIFMNAIGNMYSETFDNPMRKVYGVQFQAVLRENSAYKIKSKDLAAPRKNRHIIDGSEEMRDDVGVRWWTGKLSDRAQAAPMDLSGSGDRYKHTLGKTMESIVRDARETEYKIKETKHPLAKKYNIGLVAPGGPPGGGVSIPWP